MTNYSHADNNGHRVTPSGDRLLFDINCLDCKCPMMRDIWEEQLHITPTHTRITLNVKKLREVMKSIVEEIEP